MGLKRTSEPATEPVTTAEAKTHCRISSSSDDTYVDLLIKTAREQAEAFTKRAFITQTWALVLEKFPDYNCPISLPVNPVSSVSSIAYIDSDGVSQTWASSNYIVDSSGEVTGISPAYGKVYPSPRTVINAVTITFVAGYGAASAVPESIKHAMKFMIAHWYDNRAELGVIPSSAKNLLTPFRLMVL